VVFFIAFLLFILYNNHMNDVKIKNESFTAFSWFAAWLFTIGFLKLSFWQGLLALVIWPYYIGNFISTLV
jgi:hypothetical protein